MSVANKNYCICRCEEVSINEIYEAIDDGATTIDSIKRHTRAGMGLCQGRTCQNLVAQIIREKTGMENNKLVPFFIRQPFRPIQISSLAKMGNLLLKKVDS